MTIIDLYYSASSNQSQAVQMVAAALGVELNLKTVNLEAGEQLAPEFIKLNPQHTVPTLVDNGFVLWETRAILVYLVEKYGQPNDPLYPSDARQRATINQRLYFDMGSVYKTFLDTIYASLLKKQPTSGDDMAKIDKVFGFLDTFLEGSKYVTGEHLTVADIALFTTVSIYDLVQHDFSKFANISRWYALLRKSAPGREINESGMELARQYFAKLK